MNIIISKYAQPEIYQSIKSFSPMQADVPGTLWINTDDGKNIAVICANEKEIANALGLLQSTIATIKDITQYIYVVVQVTDSTYSHQLLSLQEMGAFTLTVDSFDDELDLAIKFIANPKRRKEKVVHPPQRDLRMYTVGEQLLLTVPGVGERKVKDLLQTGPIAWVLASLTDFDTADLLNSITKKDIASFREAIQIEDDMILAVIMKEDKE